MLVVQVRSSVMCNPPLFAILERLITKLGFSYNKILFISGYLYRKSCQQQCVLANFLIGQAELAILKRISVKMQERMLIW